MEKLKEYEKTKTLRILERERTNPLNIFTRIYGIGPKKAKELISQGIDTIDKLKENESKLNNTQKIGLKYYYDLLKRIPRSEIEEFNDKLNKVFQQVAPDNSKYEIVGSYRREAKTSGDIDIIITNKNNDTSVFNKFLDKLVEEKIVIEVLTKGKVKSLTIGKLPDGIPRRLDFLYTPPKEYAFAVLYFTGSKAFNTVMRQRALSLGYTLNEHGLSKLVNGKKDELVDEDFPDEESIFKFLHMKYQEPINRIDSRSIIVLPEEYKKESPNTETQKPEAQKPETLKIKNNKTLKVKKTKSTTKENMNNFKKNGMDTLKMLSEKELGNILKDASAAYYNSMESLLTDNEFDIIKEYVEKKYPKNKILTQIGAPVADKNKVKLPYEMPSMDKIKPDTNALDKWKVKYTGPYVISAKLDGISGLYSTENGKKKLYTRGNGKVGQDISHLIPFLKLPDISDITIRGELIMKKSVFTEKYSNDFSNSRNLVAGIVNQKKIEEEKFSDIDFIVYEVIKPSLKPSEQMDFVEKHKFDTVINETLPTVTNQRLSEILVEWRENYEYTIDGIIVVNDSIYPRTGKNPDFGFAFKMVLDDQVAEAKVVNVLWSPSKDGYLKPRIQIEPVVLGGAKIEYATAFNAAFVEDNKIGIGAIVKLVRSGDVIPHIMSVIEPAEEAKMPDVQYKWNDTHVDIVLENPEENETVQEKKITLFFKGLEVDGLGPGNVKKIIAAGFDSIPKILAMGEDDFLKVEGFKSKMANKVYNSIQTKIKEANLTKIMGVSNIFGRGFGEKKFDLILNEYPDILTSSSSDEYKLDAIKKIKGIEQKTAERFVKNIGQFIDFMHDSKIEEKLKENETKSNNNPIDTSNPLYEKHIVISGFRNKELSKELKEIGVHESSAVSKNTFLVLVKNEDEETGKVDAARKKNIPIMTALEFKNKYNLSFTLS